MPYLVAWYSCRGYHYFCHSRIHEVASPCKSLRPRWSGGWLYTIVYLVLFQKLESGNKYRPNCLHCQNLYQVSLSCLMLCLFLCHAGFSKSMIDGWQEHQYSLRMFFDWGYKPLHLLCAIGSNELLSTSKRCCSSFWETWYALHIYTYAPSALIPMDVFSTLIALLCGRASCVDIWVDGLYARYARCYRENALQFFLQK